MLFTESAQTPPPVEDTLVTLTLLTNASLPILNRDVTPLVTTHNAFEWSIVSDPHEEYTSETFVPKPGSPPVPPPANVVTVPSGEILLIRSLLLSTTNKLL